MRRSAGAPSRTGCRPEVRATRPRPAFPAGPKGRRVGFLRRWRRSCVANHQECGTVGRIDDAVFDEPSLLIGPYRARIAWIGIDDNTRCTVRQQALRKRTNECRSIAAIQHVCLADKLIETACAIRLRTETGIPVAQIIALQIGE